MLDILLLQFYVFIARINIRIELIFRWILKHNRNNIV
jgi:hypothetical protein